MRKALVITYHWPPTRDNAVRRWQKFCKYLPASGWTPIVYTPEFSDLDWTDRSTHADVDPRQVVVRVPLAEAPAPYNMLIDLLGVGATDFDEMLYLDQGDWSRKQRAAAWLRGNMLIPDELGPWIEPSVKFLSEYLQHSPVDLVVSTGPPHSTHVIALQLKRQLDLPWIADFRSSWSDAAHDPGVSLAKWAKKKHDELQQAVLREADALVESTPGRASHLRMAGHNRVEVILSGFDHASVPARRALATNKFRIHHSGSLTPASNHEAFWEALRNVGRSVLGFQSRVEVELVGHVHPSVLRMATRFGFRDNTVVAGSLPYSEAIDRMASAHVLLIAMDRSAPGSASPPQIFDYLATGRPILGIGPREGELARIIGETRTGTVVEPDDYHTLKAVIAEWYSQFVEGDLRVDPVGLEEYRTDNQTKRMAELMNLVIEGEPPTGSLPPSSSDPGESEQPS